MPVSSLLRQTLLISLLVVALISMGLGYWQTGAWLLVIALTVRYVTWYTAQCLKPIEGFVASAEQFEHGKFDGKRIPRDVSASWQSLSNAFQKMGTALANREEDLLARCTRLEVVLASMSEGVLAVDDLGNLMMANEAACAMLAIDQSNVVGRKLVEQIRIPELTSAIEKTRQHNMSGECEFQTLSEPRITINAKLTPLRSKNVASATAVVMHDVTSIRQLETMRRDFVANVSHELKTPLSVIKAYAETLKMGAINDQERNIEFVDHIESQADLLERQIQDLLQLARVESGQSNFEIAVLDLNELCRECHRQLAAVAKRHGITFETDLADQSIHVNGDAEAFRAILKNLLSNAIQFTPSQGTVTICSKLEESLAVVEVVDTGIGISPEQLTRIFERFYRADKARSRDMGGTGLGLAIVKHLTTSLGGDISVESKIGKGSTFRVEFPTA